MKKYLSTISIVTILMSTNTTIVSANNNDDAVKDGQQLIECMRKGKYDFLTFLKTSLPGNPIETIENAWDDIFNKNSCHALAVLPLLEQKIAIRTAIRDVALSCSDSDPSELIKKHKEIDAEIYYVRNIVDGSFGLRLPYNLLSKFANNAIVNRDDLYDEMSEKFISSKFFNQEEFDLLFLEFENNYGRGNYSLSDSSKGDCDDGEDNDLDGATDEADSSCMEEILDAQGKGTGKTRYNPDKDESDCNFTDEDAINDLKCTFVICESGSWKLVADKLKEFEEGLESIQEAWSEVQSQADQLAKSAKELGKRFSSAENFFGPMFEARLNGQKFGEGFDQMLSDLKDDVDIFNKDAKLDTSGFLDGAMNKEQIINKNKLKADMINKFGSRYESGFNGLQSTLDILSDNIKVIDNSIESINKMEEESNNLSSKQCKS